MSNNMWKVEEIEGEEPFQLDNLVMANRGGSNKKIRANKQGLFGTHVNKRMKFNNGKCVMTTLNDAEISDVWSIESSTSDTPSYMDTSNSDSISVIGIDNFEFNDRMKYGGPYMVQDKRNGVQKEVTTKLDSNWVDESDECGNTDENISRFKQHQNSEGAVDMKSQIAKIEVMFASFVKNIGSELRLLKQMTDVSSTSNDEAQVVMFDNNVLSSETHAGIFSESNIVTLPIVFEYPSKDESLSVANESIEDSFADDDNFDVECATNVDKISSVGNSSTGRICDETPKSNHDPNAHVYVAAKNLSLRSEDLNIRIVNARKHIPSANDVAGKKSNINTPLEDVDSNVRVVNARKSHHDSNSVEVVAAPAVTNSKLESCSNVVGNLNVQAINVSNDHDPKPPTFPINGKPHYDRMEESLEEEDISSKLDVILPLEETLDTLLVPIANEPEAKYMNRSIEALFESTFFVNQVSWKIEKDRVNIKTSCLLGHWKKSFEKCYGKDDDNTRFMAHFRRFKQAKGAAAKAAKRINAMNNRKQ